MEQQVIFRDRQELQSADLNNAQAFAADAMQHLVRDAVSDALWYTGLVVTPASGTEINVAAGRMYADGKVYAAAQQTINLFQHLPLVTKKILAVVAWGQAVDVDVQPRDFLIDLTTGETQPQAVAMQRVNLCNINVLPGAESVDPQPPAIQSSTLAVAYVHLLPTGVERVEMLSGYELPSLADHEARAVQLEAWKAQAEPRISSIATDLSALARKTDGLATRENLVEMSLDLARVKEALNLPSGYASYSSDGFGDETQTDKAAIGYSALVKNGLLFPVAGQAVAPLGMFNPYDPGVMRFEDGLVLPKFTPEARIKTSGYSGDVSISQYQFQTTGLKKYVRTVWQYHYGWHYNYSSSWYNRWYWNYYNDRSPYSYYGYYTSHQETTYKLEQVTNSINGAIIAQTMLVPNSMWLTRVGLNLTQVGASGDISVIVCETEAGKPVLGKALTHVTVPVASLKKYPVETAVEVPPVLLEAGKRYALVLITQGDHRAATVSGSSYTQGTLFYGTDGDYMQGDLTKDLMFTLYAAKFERARTEIALQSISLAGGMTDLAINAPQVVPSGCELQYEVQVGGRWYALGDASMVLSGSPDIVPLRAVLLGTSDMAPAFEAASNAITGSRPATALAHVSAARALSAASSSIQVQVVVSGWDAANHTLDCVLLSGGSTITPSATVWKDEPGGEDKRVTFSFAPAAAISSYQVKVSGARSSGSAPYTITERTDVAL